MRNRVFHFYSILSIIFILLLSSANADTNSFVITDDTTLNTLLAQATNDFMSVQSTFGMTFVNSAILIPNLDGTTYRRGSYNPTSLTYPASCVKLAYLAAAMYWCRTNSHPYNYLDTWVNPMITVSSNVACDSVVDIITGAPNISLTTPSCSDSTYLAWYNKRLYTSNWLSTHGLVENQIIVNKTYDSGPTDCESFSIYTCVGGNRMQPKCSASLMLEIIKGAIEPNAFSYMTTLLTHDKWGDYSEFGFGLPPGSIYVNKLGLAYNNLNDIAHIILPNGKEFFLAAYSDGYTSRESLNPTPYDASILGVFCEKVITTMGLDTGNPPKIIIDNANSDTTIFNLSGSWFTGTVTQDKYASNYNYASPTGGVRSATWNLSVPQSGLYEVCVWFPQGSNRATDAPYTINYNSGSTTIKVNQQVCGGRWFRLGDFNFTSGQGSVVLTNSISDSSKLVLADAVKVTKWPGAVPIKDWFLYDSPTKTFPNKRTVSF